MSRARAYHLPYCCIAQVGCGVSTNIGIGIINKYATELAQHLTEKHPADLLPRTYLDDMEKEMFLLMREPIERAKSACVKVGITPAKAVESLLNPRIKPLYREKIIDGKICQQQYRVAENTHFLKQIFYTWHKQPTHLFKYPDHLKEFAATTWLDEFPPPETDRARSISLTPEEEAGFRKYYADDIALWDSIKEPGKIIQS